MISICKFSYSYSYLNIWYISGRLLGVYWLNQRFHLQIMLCNFALLLLCKKTDMADQYMMYYRACYSSYLVYFVDIIQLFFIIGFRYVLFYGKKKAVQTPATKDIFDFLKTSSLFAFSLIFIFRSISEKYMKTFTDNFQLKNLVKSYSTTNYNYLPSVVYVHKVHTINVRWSS